MWVSVWPVEEPGMIEGSMMPPASAGMVGSRMAGSRMAGSRMAGSRMAGSRIGGSRMNGSRVAAGSRMVASGLPDKLPGQ